MPMMRKWMFFLLIWLCLIGMAPYSVQAANSPITYQVENNYPPYKYIKDGELYGFEMELSRLVFGHEYDVNISSDSFSNVQKRLINGEIDTAGIIAITEDRKGKMLFSKPITKSHIAIYINKSLREESKLSLKDLKGMKVGVQSADYTEGFLKNVMEGSQYYTYENTEEAIQALKDGKIDAVFGSQEVINYFLVKHQLTGTIVPALSDLFPVDAAYAVRLGYPELVDYINQRIDELQRAGAYDELFERYFFTHSEYYIQHRNQTILTSIALAVLALLSIFFFIQFYINFLKRRISKTNEELRDQHEWLRITLDSIGDGVIATDTQGNISLINEVAQSLTGWSEKEALGRPIAEVFHIFNERTGEPAEIPVEQVIRGGMIVGLANHTVLVARDRSQYAISDSAAPIRNEANEIIGVVMVFQDVTETYKAEKFKNAVYRIASVSNHASRLKECLSDIHKALGSIIDVSNFYIALYDEDKDTIGFPYFVDENEEQFNLASMDIRKRGKGITEYVMERGKTLLLERPEIEQLAQKGALEIIGPKPEVWMGTPLKVENKTIGAMAVQNYHTQNIYSPQDQELFEYVSNQVALVIERKQKEETIRHMAYYDPLTDLPNRALFSRRLEKALAASRQKNTQGAVFLLDLDGFKNINDTLGHHMGDSLLREVAWRLQGCISEHDTIARWGGDEFTVLLPDISDYAEAAKTAQKLIDVLQLPFEIQEYQIHMSTSMGISFYPNDGIDPLTLIKGADTALYKAKERGKNQYQLYTPDMNDSAYKRFTLENYLRHALEKDEFVLHYQPKIHIGTGRVNGMEALIRWRHPELGMVSPGEFIPLAEETGLIIPIGAWVMYTACKHNKMMQEQGMPPMCVAVNISPRQFQQSNLVGKVKKILKETGLDPEYLELELTESCIMQNVDYTIATLKELADLGVKISLDDFGTGYSSLSYLGYFIIHSIKIDRSFIQDITQNTNHSMITKAVIALGRSLKCRIIAEGVETREQMDFLKDYRCDDMQGFLFSRPLPGEEFMEFMKQYHASMEEENEYAAML